MLHCVSITCDCTLVVSCEIYLAYTERVIRENYPSKVPSMLLVPRTLSALQVICACPLLRPMANYLYFRYVYAIYVGWPLKVDIEVMTKWEPH